MQNPTQAEAGLTWKEAAGGYRRPRDRAEASIPAIRGEAASPPRACSVSLHGDRWDGKQGVLSATEGGRRRPERIPS